MLFVVLLFVAVSFFLLSLLNCITHSAFPFSNSDRTCTKMCVPDYKSRVSWCFLLIVFLEPASNFTHFCFFSWKVLFLYIALKQRIFWVCIFIILIFFFFGFYFFNFSQAFAHEYEYSSVSSVSNDWNNSNESNDSFHLVSLNEFCACENKPFSSTNIRRLGPMYYTHIHT